MLIHLFAIDCSCSGIKGTDLASAFWQLVNNGIETGPIPIFLDEVHPGLSSEQSYQVLLVEALKRIPEKFGEVQNRKDMERILQDHFREINPPGMREMILLEHLSGDSLILLGKYLGVDAGPHNSRLDLLRNLSRKFME